MQVKTPNIAFSDAVSIEIFLFGVSTSFINSWHFGVSRKIIVAQKCPVICWLYYIGLPLFQGLCFPTWNFLLPSNLWKKQFFWSYDVSIAFSCLGREGRTKHGKCNNFIESSTAVQTRMQQIEKFNIMQPSVEEDQNCVLMLMQNLLSPELILVNCTEMLLETVVCQERTHQSLKGLSSENNEFYCDYNWVIFRQICYSCSKVQKDFKAGGGVSSHRFCIENTQQQNMVLKLPIFKKWSTHFLRQTILISKSNSNKERINVYKRQPFAELKSASLKHMRKCVDNSFMSVFYNFESVNSCLNLKSSLKCYVDGKEKNDYNFCAAKCHPFNCICSSLFVYRKTGGCVSFESNSLKEKNTSGMCATSNLESAFCLNNMVSFCHDGSRIPFAFLNDLVPDCSNQNDERQLEYILKHPGLMKQWHCNSPTKFPCFPGHSRCYEFHKQCLYELHPVYNTLLHCRNGEHLTNCSELECTASFKCPKFYCITWKSTCDAKWDCPFGHDESICQNRSCIGMFKCMQSTVCIHTREICEGLPDCPLADDQMFCDLSIVCPVNCTCINYGIKCNKRFSMLNFDTFPFPFVYIHFETSLLNLYIALPRFKNAVFVKLINNEIVRICIFSLTYLMNVRVLDVSYNFITKVQSRCFPILRYLQTLKLSNNYISYLASFAFLGLNSLQSLELASNQIMKTNRQMFENLPKLQYLQISSNPLTSIAGNTFVDLSIRIIITDDHKLCCFFKNQPAHICTQHIAWPHTCEKLLFGSGYVACFWIISMVVTTLNLLSMIIACSVKQRNVRQKNASVTKHYKYTTLAQNVADIQVGVYLLSLSVVDLIYGDTFVGEEYAWRQSMYCHTISSVFLLFFLLSISMSIYLALSRLVLTKFPLRAKFIKVKRHLSILIALSVLVTLSIVVSYRYIEGRSIQPLSLCMLLGNPQQSVVLITTSIFISCLQVLGVFVLVIVYSCLLVILKKSDFTEGQSSEKFQKRDSTVSTRAKIICTSNALCWLPSGVLYVLPLTTTSFPSQLLLLNLIAVVPINAVVNPVILRQNILVELLGPICSKFCRFRTKAHKENEDSGGGPAWGCCWWRGAAGRQ